MKIMKVRKQRTGGYMDDMVMNMYCMHMLWCITASHFRSIVVAET